MVGGVNYAIRLDSGATLEVFEDGHGFVGIVTDKGWHRQTIWRDTAEDVEDAARRTDMRWLQTHN